MLLRVSLQLEAIRMGIRRQILQVLVRGWRTELHRRACSRDKAGRRLMQALRCTGGGQIAWAPELVDLGFCMWKRMTAFMKALRAGADPPYISPKVSNPR